MVGLYVMLAFRLFLLIIDIYTFLPFIPITEDFLRDKGRNPSSDQILQLPEALMVGL